jgi:hypothetical protein
LATFNSFVNARYSDISVRAPRLRFGPGQIYYMSMYTVVKELRSKMFGQHPGYSKAVFLKKTQIIIVSIYKYNVYIMF